MDDINIRNVSKNLKAHERKLKRRKVTKYNGKFYKYDILILSHKHDKLWFARFNIPEINKLFIEEGFMVYGKSQDLCIVRVRNNVIERATDVDLRICFLEYIREYPSKFMIKYSKSDLEGEIYREEVEQAFYSNQHYMFLRTYWSTLPKVDKPLLRDDTETSYTPFRNKVQQVEQNKLNLLNYEELENFYVWADQIIDFSIKLKVQRGTGSHYAHFVANICDGEELKVQSFESAIGYLLHNYSTPANHKAIICYDEKTEQSRALEGGTGKSLLAKAISKCRKFVRIDGKGFDRKDSFCFQDVNESTQVVWIDDPNPNFQFLRLNSIITEGLIGRRPYQGNFQLSATTGPKFIICSNYILQGTGSTFKRRQFVLKFGDYYSSKIILGTEMPVMDEHGCIFFAWGKEEFNRFYNYVLHCLHQYMKDGLVVFEQDLSKQRCKKQLDPEFYAWVTNKDFEIGIEHSVKEYYPAEDCYKFDVILDQLQPTTSRQIAIVLKLERRIVTPCLSDLEGSRHIRVPFKAKCPITSISVMHNCKIDWRFKV